MRLHRLILPVDLSADRLTLADHETTNQIRNVLRLSIGDRFVVCDGKGREAIVRIDDREPLVVATVVERRAVLTESPVRVVLYCAVLKRENFELVVQKTTEVGVAEIVPLVTSRTVKLGVRMDRLRKIAIEAAEQSGRGVVPVIREPIALDEALSDARRHDANVLFDPSGSSAFAIPKPLPASLGLFVGPEGGWDPDEVGRMRERGMMVSSLGPRVLRAETAAIVATYLSTSSPNTDPVIQ